ncbi:MAG TPA: hypothetical protein VMY78_13425 [Solirubrobacteraceae bacterium]|nr:hypothetical protein [Solirubrobacteraceae bacterium]
MVPDAVLYALVQVKHAREATKAVQGVQDQLQEATRAANLATAAVNRFGRVRGIAVLDVDAAKARAQTAAALKDVNGFDATKANATATVDATQASRAVGAAQRDVREFAQAAGTADLRADAAQVHKAASTATREVEKFDRIRSTATLDVDTSKLGAVNGEVRRSRREFLGLTRSIEDTGERGSRSLLGLRGAAGLLGGVAIGAGLAKGFRAATDEFEEARKVGALTEQVIKSTGGSANVTARQVEALAGSLSKKAGVDDEAIQSASNLLLTFKEVRNETGKGRDIFNQATAAALDLSAAGFGSLDSTSKQLGKALNDPLKGMTALGRAGVTFSEDQKKAIEALMATGKASDQLRAQQIILREVQSQVGGAARVQATPLDHLRVTMGNLAETAGTVLVPMLDKGARFLSKLLNEMMESRGTGGAIVDVFRTVGGALVGVVTTIRDAVNWFREHKTVTLALAAAASILLAAFVGFQVVAGIAAIIRGMAAAFWVLNAAMVANPIGIVVAAVALLAAGLVVAYRESETFRAIVDAAFKVVGAAAEWMWGAIKTVFDAIVGVIKWAWEQVFTDTDFTWKNVQAVAAIAWEKISSTASTAWRLIRDYIINPIREVLGWLIPAIGNVVSFLAARWEEVKSGALTAWNAVKTYIINPIREAFTWVRTAVGDVVTWLGDRWESIKATAATGWNAVKNNILGPIRDARDAIGGVLDGIWNRFETGFGRIVKGASDFAGDVKDKIVDGVKGGLNALIGFLNDVIGVINGLPFVDIGKVHKLATGGTVERQAVAAAAPAFAAGGTVPVRLSPGERVDYGGRSWMVPGTRKAADSVLAAVPPGAQVFTGHGQALLAAGASPAQALAAQRPHFGPGAIPGYGVGGIIDKLKGGVSGLWDLAKGGVGAITGSLPGVGDLPDWIKGTGRWVVDSVTDWIKDQIGSLFGKGGGLPGVMKAALARPPIGTPYVYGGGHGGSIAGGVDCSGGVSWALMGGDLIGGPMTTDGFKVYGDAGDGKAITIGVRGSTGRDAHTMMEIAGRFFESGSGHGWAETNGWSGHFPIHRHPPGLALGGIVPEALEHVLDPSVVGWGLREGGVLGSFKHGTDYVPRDGIYGLHRGEAVVPASTNGTGGPDSAALDRQTAALDRHTAALEYLAAAGTKGAIDALTEAISRQVGDDYVGRSMTAGTGARYIA